MSCNFESVYWWKFYYFTIDLNQKQNNFQVPLHTKPCLINHSGTSDKGLSLLRIRFLAPSYTFNVILTGNLSIKDNIIKNKMSWSQDVLHIEVSLYTQYICNKYGVILFHWYVPCTCWHAMESTWQCACTCTCMYLLWLRICICMCRWIFIRILWLTMGTSLRKVTWRWN